MDRRLFLGFTASTVITVATASLVPIAPVKASSRYTASNPLLLNKNENPLGMSPRAIEAAKRALSIGHRYAGDYVTVLAEELALNEALKPQNIGVCNGSTRIIDAIMHSQADKNATIIAPAITYDQAQEAAVNWNLAYQAVPMGVDFKMDIPAMEAASLKVDGSVLVYLVSPNNPTGRLTPSNSIIAWIKRAPDNVFFLIDEAYHELVSDPLYESTVSLVKAGYKNLVVTRTFSKIYAMAGMRIGYGIAHEEVMNEIKRYYASWNVNIVAAITASESLKDHAFFKRSFDENQTTKQMIYKTMDKLGLKCIPSEGNFILHEIGMDLKPYQSAMSERHILVGRDRGTGQRWNRLSMGTVEEMTYFIEQFQRLHN